MSKPSSTTAVARSASANRALGIAAAAALAAVLGTSEAHAQRVFGLDTSSAANTNAPTQTMWNNAFNDADGDGFAYKFAFIRSSRGGLVAGEPTAGVPGGQGRLDDGHFYDSISRATTAGMLAGSYHFARPDLAPSALHPTRTNTGANDANHYLERAGMYMRPGYLLPVFDLEDGNSELSTPEMTAWGMEWMQTIFDAKGFWPIVYTNSSYNNDEMTAQLAWHNVDANPATPHSDPRTFQWLARPGGSLATGEPVPATTAPGYPNPYGVWDPNYVTRTNSRDPAVNPWAFWQNGSGSPNSFLIDFNAANGNIEFVKDFLVPALWTTAGDGTWATMANWNSNNPGHVAGNLSTGPASRLPNSLDWVKLQNPAGGTVTFSLAAGATVRKFYTQQPVNITAGTLTVGYVPGSGGKWDLPSEFAAPVTISGGGYTAHTTQVTNDGGVFNVNGGTVTFREINLVSDNTTPGKIVIGGNATFAPQSNVTAVIRSTGNAATAGSVDLGSANRTITVNNGTAVVDLAIKVPVTGSGGLTKSGVGTLQLNANNTYSGGTAVNTGTLRVTRDANLGAAPGSAQAANITLNGGMIQLGNEITGITLNNAGSNYSSFPSLAITGGGPDLTNASANVLAGIRTIAVNAGGSGYVNQTPNSPPAVNTAATFVDLVGGGGTGATAYATVAGGVVTAITIANQGTGYTSMPTIHISSTGVGSPAVAGSGAAASVNGITLQGFALNDGGFDYASPAVSLTGGGGSGATATATSTPNWTLNANRGIQLGTSGGTLYTTAGSTITYGGVISKQPAAGDGPLTKEGPGTLVLTGVNTYTGSTVVRGGTLTVSGAGRLADPSAPLHVAAPSTTTGAATVLNLSTTSPTNVGWLSGTIATPITGTNSATINNGGQMFTVNQTNGGTFPGVIAGAGGFTKNGTAVLTLSGANTYAGGTVVNAGTLTVSGAGKLGASTGALAVNNPNTGAGTSVVVNLPAGSPTTTGSLSGAIATPTSGTNTATINNGGQAFTVNQTVPGTYQGRIAGAGSFTKNGAATLALTGTNTYTGGTNVSAGTLQVARMHEGNAVNIAAGAKLQVLDSTPTLPAHPSGDNAFVSRPSSLTIAAGGMLDLGNNDLILDYAGGTSPAEQIEDMIASGFNGGEWNGPGIISSTALADPNFILAVAENALLLQPFGDGVGDDPLFSGQVVDDTTVLVKFTHRIDLDLDGLVTGNDAAVFNAFFSEGAPATWQFGDLDYDGVFTGNDAAIFNGFYNEGLASVPEPAGLAMVACGLALLARRRRQR